MQGRAALSRAPLQELYDPSMESSAANLDDLQRSWETLKNVISEKQKSLYEALERQQHYQESLQSVSTKMEAALMDEIMMLQEEIGELQTCFSEELLGDGDGDGGDQLALQSTLTVLGERMATIHMKASGKRQLLEVWGWVWGRDMSGREGEGLEAEDLGGEGLEGEGLKGEGLGGEGLGWEGLGGRAW
ncbi:hypothetical protein CRUP_007914 [Coryphaenoides rupestris]|nr:hypothetical protein CRUP_007914 [Coryphaenoides rupestris]